MEIKIRAQGNREMQTGKALGRMGKKVLVAYAIQSGHARERWFGPDRYELAGDINELPRYKQVKCPEVVFEVPVEATRRTPGGGLDYPGLVDVDWRHTCKVCGSKVVPTQETFNKATGERQGDEHYDSATHSYRITGIPKHGGKVLA